MRKRMRLLQTYDNGFRSIANISGFLLFDFLYLSLTYLNVLEQKLFEKKIFMYPIYSKVVHRLCSKDLIHFFSTTNIAQSKLCFLLVPFCEDSTKASVAIFDELDDLKKKNLFSTQVFFFYKNFFIDRTRKFVLNLDVIFLYKNFFCSLKKNIFKSVYLNFFFLRIVFLLFFFKLFCFKNRISKH